LGDDLELETFDFPPAWNRPANTLWQPLIVKAAVERNLKLSPPQDFTLVPGRGIRGNVDGKQVAVGNPALDG